MDLMEEGGTGSARRRQLLRATFDYVTERGASDVSLRPLSAAIGTSPAVLIYLFGSKDGLMREVLALARRVELDSARRAAGTPDAGVHLRELWEWLVSDEHRPILRLFLEAYVRSLSGTAPWEDFAPASVAEWLDVLRVAGGGAAGGDDDTRATLTLAVVRGLFLDLAATGDADRVTAAFHQYLDGVDA